jgi:hypothetical protein
MMDGLGLDADEILLIGEREQEPLPEGLATLLRK